MLVCINTCLYLVQADLEVYSILVMIWPCHSVILPPTVAGILSSTNLPKPCILTVPEERRGSMMAPHFCFPIWVKYDVRDLRIGLMLLCICEFRETRRIENSDFLWAWMKLHLRVYLEAIWHFESKERRAKVYVLPHLLPCIFTRPVWHLATLLFEPVNQTYI